MRLVSSKTELTLLRAAVSKSPAVAGTVLSSLQEEHFYNEHYQEAFLRVKEVVADTGEVPTWREVLADPEITEETRERLRKVDPEKIRDRKEALRLVGILDKYRKLRGLYEMSEKLVTKLKRDKVKIDDVLEETEELFARLRQTGSQQAEIIRFGKGNNATALVKSMMDPSTKEDFLPTGFEEYDERNFGVGFGNLMVVGGSSGAGKSYMAVQLAINWSLMGENVCIVPLEMTIKEVTSRILANPSGLDSRKIQYNKLTEDEKKKYFKSYKRFIKERKKEEGTLSLFKPMMDMGIEEILASTYTLGCRVIIVDYISLLKGVDGDDQWQKLGQVARYCKIYAETNKVIIVMLCQVSEEGRIRYAQSIREHANIAWTFVATKETREAGVLNIDQLKARSGELFPFTLHVDYSKAMIRSQTPDERKNYMSKSNTTKGGKKDKNKKPSYLVDTSETTEDEE